MHTIRLATRDDLPTILDISNWAALNTPANFAIEPETLQSWQQSYDTTHTMFPWLVACDGDLAVIGFAKASPHKGRCAYAWTAEVSVYIHPNYHGRGLGTALYGALIPMLKSQGYVTLLAGITTPNPSSEKLHASVGFMRIGAFERVGWKFGRWHNVSYHELFLTTADTPPGRIRPVSEVLAQLQPSTAGS
jgi:phosphinothricin acetyltransferase